MDPATCEKPLPFAIKSPAAYMYYIVHSELCIGHRDIVLKQQMMGS